MAKLNEYREEVAAYFLKNRPSVVLQNLIKLFNLYDDEFDNLNTWDKRDLVWRQVIGFVQRFLPAVDAQAFAQGLYCIVGGIGKLSRSFNFSFGGGSIYPVSEGAAGLGFKFAGGSAAGLLRPDGGARDNCEVLCPTKTAALENLCRTTQGTRCAHVV